MIPAGISGFGKVPRMGDFVRARAHGEPVASFEGWIQEAIAYGEAKRGAEWPAVYDGGAIHAFVFRPPKKAKTDRVLAGVVRPSRDAVGRRFPLVIGGAIDEAAVAGGPHILPLLLGEFFEQASASVLAADTAVGTLADFEAQVDRVHAPQVQPADAQGRTYEYDQWSYQTPLWTAWSILYGDGNSVAPIHAMHTILECLAPFRGQEAPTTPLSLRVPLGQGGVAAAAFWIDVVRRVARWGATVPTFFFHFDGFQGSMLLQLGDTPVSSLVELWSPDPRSDVVCDLMGSAKFDVERTLGLLPRSLADVLQQPSRAVSDLLAVLTTS
ncbi:MAG: hypothetical protein NVS3B10_29190 [Polyangiales bacterium]